MANPGGSNQFGNYTIQPAYGDVKKQTQLTKAAPMSGSPVAKQAITAPRRLGRQAARGKAATSTPQPQVPSPTVPAPQGPTPNVFQSIAQIPGASPLVQQIFTNG